MANVVRDPRQHPDAIIPDLATNNVFKFSKDQVAFVYGSLWKQRYFTKVGDDYFPLPVQWDVVNKKWSNTRCRRREAIGGLLSILLTICTARLVRSAMAAIRSATTSTLSKSRMECRLRALPRTWQRTRRASYARQYR